MLKHHTKQENTIPENFIELLKIKWNEIHEKHDVFRYKISNLREKLIEDRYFIQLNPDRGTKRRQPEEMHSLQQPFDGTKFNFTKVSTKEYVYSMKSGEDDNIFLVNVSPISRYHSLFCPHVGKCLPQIITLDSLEMVVDMISIAQDGDLRIGFNSLCAFASVNHLHYHLLFEKTKLAIENANWTQLKGPVYITQDYPVPAFRFTINNLSDTSKAYTLINYLMEQSIAHNVLITTRSLEGAGVNVIIWPRMKTEGVKNFTAFNVAVCELSGWFPVYDEKTYDNISTQMIESELKKWNLDNFTGLCEDIKLLY